MLVIVSAPGALFFGSFDNSDAIRPGNENVLWLGDSMELY